MLSVMIHAGYEGIYSNHCRKNLHKPLTGHVFFCIVAAFIPRMNHQKSILLIILSILLFILFYFISILLFNVKEKYTHQIGYVSLNVSFNLSIINLSKTRNNVYLRSYAVI